MGLGGRKVKQRIGNDPRNLSWADDAARFGQNYLSKFGWDASKGLGAEGEGRTSALKVAQKLDMLGIGAAHQKDPNGIAWKQNKDFEALLRRLNAANEGGEVEEVKTTVSGFSKAVESNLDGATSGVASLSVVEVRGNVGMIVDEEESEKKKGKKEKKSKKDNDKDKDKDKDKDGKRKRSEDAEDQKQTLKKVRVVEETPLAESDGPKRSFVPRHRAHRARAIAAKSISSKSSAHISEILGIAPENSITYTSSLSIRAPDQGKLTIINSENEPSLEKLTTSTKSVADYFKEKLAARAGPSSSGSSTPQTGARWDEEEEDRPRGGLGMGFAKVSWESSQQLVKAEIADGESQRIGLSGFPSLMSSSFLAGTMSLDSTSSSTPTPVEENSDENSDSGCERAKRKERKRLRKEEKAKRKAEKGAKKALQSISPAHEVSQKKTKKDKKRKTEERSSPEEQTEKKAKKSKSKRLEDFVEAGVDKKKKSKKDSDS